MASFDNYCLNQLCHQRLQNDGFSNSLMPPTFLSKQLDFCHEPCPRSSWREWLNQSSTLKNSLQLVCEETDWGRDQLILGICVLSCKLGRTYFWRLSRGLSVFRPVKCFARGLVHKFSKDMMIMSILLVLLSLMYWLVVWAVHGLHTSPGFGSR